MIFGMRRLMEANASVYGVQSGSAIPAVSKEPDLAKLG